jgi:hypothetical protein
MVPITLSFPSDGGIITIYFITAIGGVVAFVVVVLFEAVIFYLLKWASLMGCLLLSLAVNLASTVLCWLPAFFGLMLLEDLSSWFLLFILSTIIEGSLCFFLVKRVREAIKGCLIANALSYLFLMMFFLLVSG